MGYYDDDGWYKSYWYILMVGDRKIGVANITDTDLYDYDKRRFLLGEDGEKVRFKNEDEAIEYVNDKYKPEFIDDECITPNNQAFFKEAEHD